MNAVQLRIFVTRILGFTAGWLVLTAGETRAPALAAFFVLASAYMSVRFLPVRLFPRVLGLARFGLYFVKQSVVGGLDVARRALSPALPLAPDLIEFESRFKPESAPLLFTAGLVSLLPGTLCAEIKGSRLWVHTVDRTKPVARHLQELETEVAALFGPGFTRAGEDNQ